MSNSSIASKACILTRASLWTSILGSIAERQPGPRRHDISPELLQSPANFGRGKSLPALLAAIELLFVKLGDITGVVFRPHRLNVTDHLAIRIAQRRQHR